MKFPWLSIFIRFVILVLLQVVIFKRIEFTTGIFAYTQFFVYPIWIMLMPIRIPKPLILIGAFIMGLVIDMFYDSLGVHAATLVFMAFIRDFILNLVEPEVGYDPNISFNLKKIGLLWYASYIGIFLLIHLFVYFSVEAFSFVYMEEILISTVMSLIFSSLLMIILILIFNPKY